MKISETFIEAILRNNFADKFQTVYDCSMLLQYLDKKMKAIDLSIRIVAVDGTFTESELTFIKDLCDRLNITTDKRDKIIEYSNSLAQLNSQWISIYE